MQLQHHLVPCASRSTFSAAGVGAFLGGRHRTERAYIGTLITHYEQHGTERYSVLQLQPSDPMSSDKPPPLYEPLLTGFAPIASGIRGFEWVGLAALGVTANSLLHML